jgi:hypothetical protein
VVFFGCAVEVELSRKRMSVHESGKNSRTCTNSLPEVDLRFEYLDLWIGLNGANEHCVSGPEVVHAKISSVPNDHAGWIDSIYLR